MWVTLFCGDGATVRCAARFCWLAPVVAPGFMVVFEGSPLSARMRTLSRAARPLERRRLTWSGAFPLCANAWIRHAGAQPQTLALKGRQRNNCDELSVVAPRMGGPARHAGRLRRRSTQRATLANARSRSAHSPLAHHLTLWRALGSGNPLGLGGQSQFLAQHRDLVDDVTHAPADVGVLRPGPRSVVARLNTNG